MKQSHLKPLFVASSLLLVVPWGFYLWKFHASFSENQEIWGQLGDFIGGVAGPMLSLIGILGVLFTLHNQIKQDQKTDQSRRISDIRNSLERLDASMDLELPNVLSKEYNLPPRDRFIYLSAEKLANDIMLTQEFLQEIQIIDQFSTSPRYFAHKYTKAIQILVDKKYLPNNLLSSFGSAGE